MNERRFPSPGIPGFGFGFGTLGDDDVGDPEHVEDSSLGKAVGEAKEEDCEGSDEVGHGESFQAVVGRLCGFRAYTESAGGAGVGGVAKVSNGLENDNGVQNPKTF